MKTVRITEQIIFELMLTPRIFDKDTYMLNEVRYLSKQKHDLISRTCPYKIEGSTITLLGVQFAEIEPLINLINA